MTRVSAEQTAATDATCGTGNLSRSARRAKPDAEIATAIQALAPGHAFAGEQLREHRHQQMDVLRGQRRQVRSSECAQLMAMAQS
jgi:hypothetical protein